MKFGFLESLSISSLSMMFRLATEPDLWWKGKIPSFCYKPYNEISYPFSPCFHRYERSQTEFGKEVKCKGFAIYLSFSFPNQGLRTREKTVTQQSLFRDEPPDYFISTIPDTAPCGSSMTANLLTSGTGVTGTMIVPPNEATFSTLASQSSTAK